jgi:hypothetical protein
MRWLVIALVSLAGCVTAAKVALMPRAAWTSNDPSPTAPLVEQLPDSATPAYERKARETLGDVGTVGVGVAGAAALGWLLGAAAPLIGTYGTFEENALFDPNAAKTPQAPTAVQ